MARYYKMIVTTTYYSERIVKANSKEEVDAKANEIVKTIDLLDDIPSIDAEIEERPDMDDDDVDIDLTKSNA